MRPVVLFLMLAGCAAFPEVDAAMDGRGAGPAPQLLPTDELVAQADVAFGAETAVATLQARAAALRARAARIRAMPTG